ncbi:hypothetical protein [Granulicella sp. dw_53]|uniref:hypothetical protein n=1 Tax=Granulicella sp. dw_53 TaxID=2719792 RepID=UPI001BD4AC78|nr:hypothetical protein [Granulicella sp. dw_53]
MDKGENILTASAGEQTLVERIVLQEQQIADALAPYEPHSATYSWFDTLRAIEECINLMTVDWNDEDFERDLISLPLTQSQQIPSRLVQVLQGVKARFGEQFCNRFSNLLIQGMSIAIAFASHGFMNVAAGFQTVGTMMGYFQSRRRHFVGLLHMLPNACRGKQIVEPLDTLNIFLPIIELSAIQMMGAQNALIVKVSRAKLRLPECESSEIAMLDSLFLEPERARIIDVPITTAGAEMLKSREPLSPDRLFSAAELRNDILAIEAAYAEFNLAGTNFALAAALVRRLSRNFIDRDFWIAISPADLDALSNELGLLGALRAAFVNTSTGYMACLSTYAPLVLIDGVYRSTVTLLSRFLYYWRARSLDRLKLFQIRAGFIFEQAVANELIRQGFIVQDITRINRREFDVVTVRNDVIWNFQCKNNFVDLACVDVDARRFARYNSMLVRSYERALTKEQNREQLLKSRLSLDVVQHLLVSRFPVICDNPRIVPFSRIAGIANLATSLLTIKRKSGTWSPS